MIRKTLAHYEVRDLLGRGGMGEVYRAHDTKLDRDVALKILPEDFARDPMRAVRFRREAQLLASLNHPNIAAIHGIEEDQGLSFLVMELAEGEDLAHRIRRGALDVDEVRDIAAKIAAGLEEAHEKGVVHRDLKPANVMLSPSGDVKILDFGLARAYAGETADEGDPALSPTITAAMTQAGMVLGSAAYMSPEQAKGRDLDRRTDIWAFGVIVYEMLTGRPLFEGETISETMAAVLKDPVRWELLPSGLPPSMRALLERCLERDPMLRLRDIGEARIHLLSSSGSAMLQSSPVGTEHETATAKARRAWIPWTVAALLAVALVGLQVFGADRSASPAETPFLSVLLPPESTGFHLTGANPAQIAVSPDGRRAVFGARDDRGRHNLWLREFSENEATLLAGSQGAQYPFWSPDSRSIGFCAEGMLRVIELDGLTRRDVTPAGDMKGGCWLDDGTILFSPTATAAIWQVDSEGGEATVVTDVSDEPVSNSHRLPRRLPGTSKFLYAARTAGLNIDTPVRVMLGDLQGEPPRELLAASGQAEFENGHILYVVNGTLYARPFDLETFEFEGTPTTIANGVSTVPGAALALMSVADGLIAYHPGQRETLSIRLTWYGFDGTDLGTLGDSAGFGTFDIAPEGTRVVFTSYNNQAGTGDLFLHDVASDVRTRLTFEPIDESSPIWSPDGEEIYYVRADAESFDVVAFQPEGRQDARVIHSGVGSAILTSVSPDGRHLAASVSDSTGNTTYVGVLDLQDPQGFVPVDDVELTSFGGIFSPDGKWISFASRVSGEWKLYLKTFPTTGRKWQITQREALWYDWHPDGDRILHQWSGTELFSTAIDLSGSAPRIGQTELLIRDFASPVTALHEFQVAPSGDRVLVSDAGIGETGQPVRLVQNWGALVR